MGDICLDSENWDDLCGMVKAAGIDLETLAQETRAIRRRRAVRDAETSLPARARLWGWLGFVANGVGVGGSGRPCAPEQGRADEATGQGRGLADCDCGRLLLAGCKARVPDSIGSRQLRLVECLVYFKAGQQGDRLAPACRVGSGPAVFRRSRSQRCQRRRKLRTLCGRTRRDPDRRPRLYLVSRLAPCPPCGGAFLNHAAVMRCAGVARMEAPSTFSRPCAGPATGSINGSQLRTPRMTSRSEFG